MLLAGTSPRRGAAREALRSLSACEVEILADGQSAADVAARLGLSARTMEGHARAILARLEARNRAEAVRIYLEAGLSGEE